MMTSSRRWTNERSQTIPAVSMISAARILTATVRCQITTTSVLTRQAQILKVPASSHTAPVSIPTLPDAIKITPARSLTSQDFTKTLVFRVFPTISPQRHFLRMEKQKRKEVNHHGKRPNRSRRWRQLESRRRRIGGLAEDQRLRAGECRLRAGQAHRRIRRAENCRRRLRASRGRLADRPRRTCDRAMDVPQRHAWSQAASPRAIRRRQRRSTGDGIDEKIRTRQADGQSENRRSSGEINCSVVL